MIEAPPSPKPQTKPHLDSGNSSPTIAVRSLRKKIGQQEILRGVDLEVRAGETLVLIGRSGGGKTVLLKHMIGLLEPDSGEIWIHGENIIGMNERQLGAIREKVGILFQSGALFDSMNVEDNIAFPLREAGEHDPEVLHAKVVEMLEVMEMEGQEKKMPESLSGGMKKRVGLARALALDPELLFSDEPTSGLDPIMTAVVDQLTLKLTHGEHMTAVVVTHDMTSAFRIATRMIMLGHGSIVAQGTPDEIRNNPNPEVQQFINGEADGPIPLSLSQEEHEHHQQVKPRPFVAARHRFHRKIA